MFKTCRKIYKHVRKHSFGTENVGQNPKFVKVFIKRFCKFFGKYKNKFFDFFGDFRSFLRCKISYLWYQTKNLKVAIHFHICILQHPTKCEAEVLRIKKVIPIIQKISVKCPKIEKKLTNSSIKRFEKF